MNHKASVHRLLVGLSTLLVATALWSQPQSSDGSGAIASPETESNTREVVATKVIEGGTGAAAALVMVRDAESGELRAPTAEERARLTVGVDPLNRSDAGLTERYYSDGSVGVRLHGRFQSFSTVRLPEGGTAPETDCTTDGGQALLLESSAQKSPSTKTNKELEQ